LGANREIRKITPVIVGNISDYRLFFVAREGDPVSLMRWPAASRVPSDQPTVSKGQKRLDASFPMRSAWYFRTTGAHF
jgi:hypothetical protein